MSSKSNEWATPKALFAELDAEFHFTLDPCCTHENAKCEKHYTEADDGLAQNWQGERVFCNPPYGSAIKHWVKKCYEEAQKPDTLVVMLIPSRTDTTYFHSYIYITRLSFASSLGVSILTMALKALRFPVWWWCLSENARDRH